jgi:hypothetical protein
MGNWKRRPNMKANPTRKITMADMADAIAQTELILARLKTRALADVERRSQETSLPDGYRSGGLSDGGKGGDGSITELHAMRLESGAYGRDPVLGACQTVRNLLDSCWDDAVNAEDAWDYLCSVPKQRRGRENSLEGCLACLRDDVTNVGNDRIRSGYCLACYKAWLKTGHGGTRQDRPEFEKTRRDLRVAEDAS